MASSFSQGTLLGGSYPLPGGLRIRLRLARGSDSAAIRALIGADRDAGAAVDLDLARIVHFDPRRQCVLCATALLDGRETLVAVGSVVVSDGRQATELLVIDDSLAGLDELMREALGARAGALLVAAKAA
jgi:hypothetical protein